MSDLVFRALSSSEPTQAKLILASLANAWPEARTRTHLEEVLGVDRRELGVWLDYLILEGLAEPCVPGSFRLVERALP